MRDRLFWIPTEAEIKNAETTDVYFEYAVEALRFAEINPKVTMEVYTRKLPFPDTNWAVLCGVYEVAKLLEDLPVDVDSMEEGELFLVDANSAVYEPVMRVYGRYQDFAKYENPILGFLCQASGVSTKAARISLAADGKSVISFGTRRAHPALAAMIERSSLVGGLNSVSNVLAARLLGMNASGTMPHAFIICIGDEIEAWRIFDRAIPKSVPRIALVDTFSDEKFAAIRALEALGQKLYAVRLDTPSTRRGDLKKIVQEVRWELGVRKGAEVKIFVSGGLDETEVIALRDFVDGFGVGTSISAANVIDFGGKIVEVERMPGVKMPISKRGDLSGVKNVFRDESTMRDLVTLQNKPPISSMLPLLTPLLREGKIVREFKSIKEIGARTSKLVRHAKRAAPTIEFD